MIFPTTRAVRNAIIAIYCRLGGGVGSRHEGAVRNAEPPASTRSSYGSNGFPIARAVRNGTTWPFWQFQEHRHDELFLRTAHEKGGSGGGSAPLA